MLTHTKLIGLTGCAAALITLLSSCSITPVQADYAPPDLTPYLCSMANREPEFPGGIDTLSAYIDQHKHYPDKASQAGINGHVFVSFVVGKDGQVTDVSVLKGLGYGCDEEAVRVVREMPRWIPGKRNDEYVNVKYTIPVSFGTND